MLASLGRVPLGLTLFLGSLVAPISLSAQDAPPSELSLSDAKPDGSDLGSSDDGLASAPSLMNGVVWNNVRTDRQAGLCIKADPAVHATEIAGMSTTSDGMTPEATRRLRARRAITLLRPRTGISLPTLASPLCSISRSAGQLFQT